MKKTAFVKIISMLLALATLFCFTSCDGGNGKSKETDENGKVIEKDDEPMETGIPVVEDDELEDDDLAYVLIYNPLVFDENKLRDISQLSTGDLGSQIEVGGYRGDGLEDPEAPEKMISFTQAELNANINWEELNLDGSRGDPLGVDYEEGDEREFYCYPSSGMDSRIEKEFECVYAGEYCYIWSSGDMDEDELEKYGEEFDENIYEEVVDTFGSPRFVGDSGKVNLMFYPMMNGLGGCFSGLDIFSEDEVNERLIKRDGYNTNHAMVHINSDYASMSNMRTWMYGTMAHEFQHLICASNYFSTANEAWCRTWLNEAMSGYIEEELYEGAKDEAGHYSSFNKSDLIRRGQSLYNFRTGYDDIGVYGSVYYFSQYLSEIAGDDVFSEIHEYWRESYSDTLCEAEAIMNAVPKSVKLEINSFIEYPDEVRFESSAEEWMSKLTLDFYLKMLSEDTDIDAFENIDRSSLIYDERDGTTIQGGGRIIVSVKDAEFEVPSDADNGLIYVGLDKDFEVITGYVYQ